MVKQYVVVAYEKTFLYYFVDTENSETETIEGYQRSEDSTPDLCSDEDDSISTSDSDESNDSDEENVFKNGLPLFQDSSLSVSEFNAILLALRQRHNIANIALDSILKLLELCLPKGSQLPKSGYLFEKETEKELEYTCTKYLTCTSCQTLLTKDFLCENQMCDSYQRYAKGENSSVFYTIDILPEIKNLITGWLRLTIYFLV